MADADQTAPTPIADQPPGEFVRLVRQALVHLYDPAHLLRQPLRGLLSEAMPRHGDAAQNLRDLILDAIESLEPPDHHLADERDRRPYLVLVHRYVDGFGTEDIVARLHISPRQFQREHQKGLQAVAARLWGYCRGCTSEAGSTSESLMTSLEAEVDTLGVELEPTSLRDLLEAVQAPANALAMRSGALLSVLPVAAERRCLCDRTLAKQGILAGLSSLLSRYPKAVEVIATSHQRLPCFYIYITPALGGDQGDSLYRELAVCRTLLAAQGGEVQVLRDSAGLVCGLRLLFRSETAAHVLVIDDDEKMLQLYERYLASGRYAVSRAASAQEAEALLRKLTPDAIVLDVMMREVDGWELLQRLRSRPELQAVPIIVCSILNEPQLAFALGAQAYLKKPISADSLLATLDNLRARE